MDSINNENKPLNDPLDNSKTENTPAPETTSTNNVSGNTEPTTEASPPPAQSPAEPQSQASSPPPKQDDVKSKPKEKRGCFGFIVIFTVVFMLLVAVGVCILFGILIMNISLPSTIPELQFGQYPVYFQETYVSGNNSSSNKIAVIEIQGIIMQARGGGIYTIADSENICEQLKYVAHDPSVKGVVIRLNTPGGEITASDVIHHQILELRKSTGMPVVASMDAIAASGGYYVAVACNHIVAHRMTLTGSIGVIIQAYKYHDLFKKIGIEADVYTSGPMKDLLNGARKTTPPEKKLVQKLVAESYDEFVNIVAEGRPKLTVEQIKNTKIGDGRIFHGKDAYQLNMVDQLGFFDDAVQKAADLAGIGTDYKAVKYMRPFSLAQIFGGANAKKDQKINIELPGSNHWLNLLSPGRLYFLPQPQ